jgi:hypothetical protein
MSGGGTWSPSVKSKVTSDQTRKEGTHTRNRFKGTDTRGSIGLLMRQAVNCPRKEGRRQADYRGTGAKKRPLGGFLGDWRG